MAAWRRKRKRQPFSSIEYAWSIYQDEQEQAMAVAGGMITAYRCSVSDNALIAAPTTYYSRDCANVEAALEILGRGETCIVAGPDMAALRTRLAEHVGAQA